MRSLALVLIYLFVVAAAALAHPRFPPRIHDLEIEKVAEKLHGSHPPSDKKDGPYNGKYRSKRSTMHIKKRGDDNEDVSDDFERDLKMGYDASGDMQACYGYYSKTDNGYPFGVDYELKKKQAQEGNAFKSQELRKRVQYRSKRPDENLNENDLNRMADHEKDCCSGYTEEGLFEKRACECHPLPPDSWRDGLMADLQEVRCAEKIYNDYRKKHPSEEYNQASTLENYGTSQEDRHDYEEELQLQKTYENYYQDLGGECFQRKVDDKTKLSKGDVFETEEGQIHEKNESVLDIEDSIYETEEGQIHKTNYIRSENVEDVNNNDDYDNHDNHDDTNTDSKESFIEESSTDDPLDFHPSMKQKGPVVVPVPLLEFICTTNRLSPLSVDVFRIAEYFNNDGLQRICRVKPLQVNRCARIGGIRSASIAVCDHYFGWQAVCADVGKQIFELIRRCEELIDGHYKVSGKIIRQGWGGNVIVYRLV